MASRLKPTDEALADEPPRPRAARPTDGLVDSVPLLESPTMTWCEPLSVLAYDPARPPIVSALTKRTYRIREDLRWVVADEQLPHKPRRA